MLNESALHFNKQKSERNQGSGWNGKHTRIVLGYFSATWVKTLLIRTCLWFPSHTHRIPRTHCFCSQYWTWICKNGNITQIDAEYIQKKKHYRETNESAWTMFSKSELQPHEKIIFKRISEFNVLESFLWILWQLEDKCFFWHNSNLGIGGGRGSLPGPPPGNGAQAVLMVSSRALSGFPRDFNGHAVRVPWVNSFHFHSSCQLAKYRTT